MGHAMGPAARLTLCAVLIVLVCGGFGNTDDCSARCCKSNKDKKIVCDLTRRKQAAIPKTEASRYEIMHFSHGSNLSVHHNAMDHLQEALLTDLDDLIFLGNRETQSGATNGISIVPNSNMTIDGVKNLRLDPNSFDGWQNEGSTVWIKNIENCKIDQSAFAPSTKIKRLLLENITSLVLGKGTLRATVDELLLRNVSIVDCPQGTFGGQVNRLLMFSVRLNNVMPGCVQPETRYQTISITGSHLGRVSRSGITGSITDVTVNGSEISTLDSGGIRVDVSRFSLNATNIKELHSDALQVQADQAISLHGLNISRLHMDAFRGLRVVGAPNRGINVTELSVARADVGSLTFADGADVRVKMLKFTIQKECNREGDVFADFVYVESAWQPAFAISNVSSRLHTFFQPLFACDLEDALDAFAPKQKADEQEADT